MKTSPLLARRVIPVKERVQKALLLLLLTAISVASVWYFAGASTRIEARFLLLMAAISLLGLIFALYFWVKKHDQARTKEGYRSVRRRIDDERHGRGWISRLSYNFKRFTTGVVVAVGLLLALAGVALLALQVFAYLKTGSWRSVSVLSVGSRYLPWLDGPQSWFGLNAIVRDVADLLPLSLTLVLFGWLVAGFGAALRQRAAR